MLRTLHCVQRRLGWLEQEKNSPCSDLAQRNNHIGPAASPYGSGEGIRQKRGAFLQSLLLPSASSTTTAKRNCCKCTSCQSFQCTPGQRQGAARLPAMLMICRTTPFTARALSPCRLRTCRCLKSLAACIAKVTLGCALRNSRILLQQFPQGVVDRNQVIEQETDGMALKQFSKKLTSAWWVELFEHQFLQMVPLLHLISYSRYTTLGRPTGT